MPRSLFLSSVLALALLSLPSLARAEQEDLDETEPAGATPAQPAASSGSSAEGGGAQRTWGWVAVGTGGALLLVSGYSFYRAKSASNDSKYEDYRATVPEGQNTCDMAKIEGRTDITDICDTNKTWGTVFLVTLPIGLAATATGVVLLATAPPAKKKTAKLSVAPSVSPNGGGVWLGYRF